VFNPVVVIR